MSEKTTTSDIYEKLADSLNGMSTLKLDILRIIERLDKLESKNKNHDDFREALSREQHEIWVHWMKYLFSVCTKTIDGRLIISPEHTTRWLRQAYTTYDNLSESEKDSDREQADKILRVMEYWDE